VRRPNFLKFTPEERATQIADVMDTGYILAMSGMILAQTGEFVPEATTAAYVGILAMATSLYRASR